MEEKHGSHFHVEIHNDHVVKIPRTEKVKERMKEIVELQNTVAEHFEEVHPCWLIEEECIVMKRINGTSGSDFEKAEMKKTMRDIRKRIINKTKVDIRDEGRQNVIFQEDGKIQLIDFSSAELIE